MFHFEPPNIKNRSDAMVIKKGSTVIYHLKEYSFKIFHSNIPLTMQKKFENLVYVICSQ
jgi:hypothetical protein